MITNSHKGIALLVAIILASVSLTLGLSLVDVAFKQVVLASSAKNSYVAFYAADTAMECALYWDQEQDGFSYSASTLMPANQIFCGGTAIDTASYTTSVASGIRKTSFTTGCINNANAVVTIHKASTGATSLFANGYNNCNASDTRRTERGLKVSY